MIFSLEFMYLLSDSPLKILAEKATGSPLSLFIGKVILPLNKSSKPVLPKLASEASIISLSLYPLFFNSLLRLLLLEARPILNSSMVFSSR